MLAEARSCGTRESPQKERWGDAGGMMSMYLGTDYCRYQGTQRCAEETWASTVSTILSSASSPRQSCFFSFYFLSLSEIFLLFIQAHC